MAALTNYNAARQALAEAVRIDEVKNIRDKAVAMQEYARQAKDTELIGYATEIRLRAERRAGELISDLGERRGRPEKTSGGGSIVSNKDMGITDKQSMRWQKLADLEQDDFEHHVESAKKKAVNSGAQNYEIKQQMRAEREMELAAKHCALPDQKFGVILADPEWRFEPYSRETGMDRAADNHYPTSASHVIADRPVEQIAADDCVLFLWATVPMLPEALCVMAAWGFEYKSHCIWAKDRIGTGYWFRNQHELLLVGTKGSVPAPAMGTQIASLVDAPVGRHSEKPGIFYDLIEGYFPTLSKIELNARTARPGWEAWGYEAPAEAAE